MFIDAHLHTVRRMGLPRDAVNSNFATPDELIGIMDRTGVDRGILLPSSSPEGCYQQVTTEDVLEVCETYPDRFHAFCNVDPRAGSNSPDADLSFHLNYYKGQGCLGVGEITASLEIGDPLVQNLFKHCEDCELPVLFHLAPKRYGCYGLIDTVGLAGLEASLKSFDKLVFIGHSPPFWAEISADVSIDNRNAYPNGPVLPGGALPRLMDKTTRTCSAVGMRPVATTASHAIQNMAGHSWSDSTTVFCSEQTSVIRRTLLGMPNTCVHHMPTVESRILRSKTSVGVTQISFSDWDFKSISF